MEFEHRTRLARTSKAATTDSTLVPGKHTLTEQLVVQRREGATPPGAESGTNPTVPSSPAPLPAAASSRPQPTLQMLFGFRPAPAEHPGQVHTAATRGTATPATKLPYTDQIQRAFGRHDISGIQAHVGGDAAASAREMGAQAYATGDHVVLGEGADLRTVAHEAAHVVQQRDEVQLESGVGEAGDAYERQADEVADRVVRGESAERLLDAAAPASDERGVAAHDGACSAARSAVRTAGGGPVQRFIVRGTGQRLRVADLTEQQVFKAHGMWLMDMIELESLQEEDELIQRFLDITSPSDPMPQPTHTMGLSPPLPNHGPGFGGPMVGGYNMPPPRSGQGGPAYEPEKWTSKNDEMETETGRLSQQNCYGYATNYTNPEDDLLDEYVFEPGDHAAVNNGWFEDGYPDREVLPVNSVREAAVADGLIWIGPTPPPPQQQKPGYYLVCLLESSKDEKEKRAWHEREYHWRRCDSDGTWSEKSGECDPNRVGHPESTTKEYDVFVGYFWCPDSLEGKALTFLSDTEDGKDNEDSEDSEDGKDSKE